MELQRDFEIAQIRIFLKKSDNLPEGAFSEEQLYGIDWRC